MAASRSGRVIIKSNNQKTIVAGGRTGGSTAIYRVFNSGKVGDTIEVFEKQAGNLNQLGEVAWKDSLDIPVTSKEIVVRAGNEEAEVVYDFLGIT